MIFQIAFGIVLGFILLAALVIVLIFVSAAIDEIRSRREADEDDYDNDDDLDIYRNLNK